MASTTQERADVPLHGGYTRFELELEVPTSLSYVTAPNMFHQHINTLLVRPVPCESCLSQLPSDAEVLRQARVRSLSRLPAIFQGAQVYKIPTVGTPHRRESAADVLTDGLQSPWADAPSARVASAGAFPARYHHPRTHEQDAIRRPEECCARTARLITRHQVCIAARRETDLHEARLVTAKYCTRMPLLSRPSFRPHLPRDMTLRLNVLDSPSAQGENVSETTGSGGSTS